MLTTLLPYRRIDYQTSLTPDQIGQRLTETIITGFSFFSSKPYYGDFTPYSFSVRKTYSKLKKQSFGPTVEGTYKTSNGTTNVTLSLRPHPALIVAFGLFSFPLLLFIARSVTEFFKTGEIDILLNGLILVLFVYGIFWIIFQVQIRTDILFWEHTLQLQETEVGENLHRSS